MKLIQTATGPSVMVDDCDYEHLNHYKWFIAGRYVRRRRLKQDGPGNQQISIHHEIVGRPPVGVVVDHIDHNPLNNTRQNLRLLTAQANHLNRRRSCNNSSGVNGLSYCSTTKRWMVCFVLGGRRVRRKFKSKTKAVSLLTRLNTLRSKEIERATR